jgi:hypothetical protein
MATGKINYNDPHIQSLYQREKDWGKDNTDIKVIGLSLIGAVSSTLCGDFDSGEASCKRAAFCYMSIPAPVLTVR